MNPRHGERGLSESSLPSREESIRLASMLTSGARRAFGLDLLILGLACASAGYYSASISGLSFLHPSSGYPCGTACNYASCDAVRVEFWGGTGLFLIGI